MPKSIKIEGYHVAGLLDCLREYERARKRWHDLPGTDHYANDRAKQEIVVAGAGVVGYLKGILQAAAIDEGDA